MTQQDAHRHQPELRDAAIRLYRTGNTEGEIIRNKNRLVEIDKLGSAWDSLNQSSLNRWVKSAKENDPDLEIWHLLNRRRRKPGVYTHWKPDGVIILLPWHDRLTGTMYLGLGGTAFVQTKSGETIPVGYSHPPQGPRMNHSDAVGPYVAELAILGYSLRDIVNLWKGVKTRHPDMDKAPKVQWLAKQLRGTLDKPIKPMSFSTIGRILRVYSYGPVDESWKTAQMTEEGGNIQ